MSLIKCNECGNEVSDQAEYCIHCGYPLNDDEDDDEVAANESSRFGILKTLFFILITVGLGYYVFNTLLPTEDQNIVKNTVKEVIVQEKIIFDKEYQIKEDYYLSIPIELTKRSDVRVQYKLMQGPPIDVFFFDQNDYEAYINSKDFEYYNTLSTFGLYQSDKIATHNSGKYYVVFDNTDIGSNYPPMNLKDDVATLDIKIIQK